MIVDLHIAYPGIEAHQDFTMLQNRYLPTWTMLAICLMAHYDNPCSVFKRYRVMLRLNGVSNQWKAIS